MDVHAKVHPCYYDSKHHVSCVNKKNTNLQMEMTILEMLKDIELRQSYLPHHWYMLKYFVRALHAVYQLLYKILVVYGNSSMKTKLRCHNLIDGPRSINDNICLFKELVMFTQIQTQLIGAQVCFVLKLKFQDTISKLFFRLTKFLHTIIWYDNSTSDVMHDGLPVKMRFL